MYILCIIFYGGSLKIKDMLSLIVSIITVGVSIYTAFVTNKTKNKVIELEKISRYSDKLERDNEFKEFYENLITGTETLLELYNSINGRKELVEKMNVINTEIQKGVLKYGEKEISYAWAVYFNLSLETVEVGPIVPFFLIANLFSKVKNIYYSVETSVDDILKI